MNEHTQHSEVVQNKATKSVSPSETLKGLERIVESVTGQSADAIRRQTLSEIRRGVEAKAKHKLTFHSHFPLIGRGSVMRDKTIDHDYVEALLTQSLQ